MFRRAVRLPVAGVRFLEVKRIHQRSDQVRHVGAAGAKKIIADTDHVKTGDMYLMINLVGQQGTVDASIANYARATLTWWWVAICLVSGVLPVVYRKMACSSAI